MHTSTHHNFKSLVPDVTDAEGISDHVGRAICHQDLFDRKTSPWEMSQWDVGELEGFSISLEDVDRLYHISRSPEDEDDEPLEDDFELLVRVEYNDRPLFVELVAGCRFSGFDYQGGGEIYVSFNPNIFTKTIQTKVTDEDELYASLTEDGYEVERKSEYDRPYAGAKLSTGATNPPLLKFLCHLSVHQHRLRLSCYPHVLPGALVASVTEFIAIRDAIDHYDTSE